MKSVLNRKCRLPQAVGSLAATLLAAACFAPRAQAQTAAAFDPLGLGITQNKVTAASVLHAGASAPLMLPLTFEQGGLAGSADPASGALKAHGLSFLFYTPPAGTDAAGRARQNVTLPATLGFANSLALTSPEKKKGSLTLSGMFYLSGGSKALAANAAASRRQALSEDLAYQTHNVSLDISYKNVDKAFDGGDALNASASSSGLTSDAVNQLMQAKGQSGLNLKMGWAASGASNFQFTSGSTDDANNNTHTDTRLLAYTQKLGGLNFQTQFSSADSHGGASADHRSEQRYQLDGTLARGLSVSGFLHSLDDAASSGACLSEFDFQVHEIALRDAQISAEASQKKVGASVQAQHTVQVALVLPRFVGMRQASWTLGMAEQIADARLQKQSLSAVFEAQLPGARLPRELSGVRLHLEYTGNTFSDGACSINGGTGQHAANRRLLRLVSGPGDNRWLNWSASWQPRQNDQGQTLATGRAVDIQAKLTPTFTAAYSDRDQIQSDGGLSDKKERKLHLALAARRSVQIIAEYVHGANMADQIKSSDSYLFGFSGPIASDQTLSVSLGRSDQSSVSSPGAAGTTLVTAYTWHQSDVNQLSLSGNVTAWDCSSGADAKAKMDAQAHLDFKRLY